jgi:hypothetical protein
LLSGFAIAMPQHRRRLNSSATNNGLSEIALGVFVYAFAAPTALKISAILDPRADVQIGGGVRVSDAFQAKLGWQLIAI